MQNRGVLLHFHTFQALRFEFLYGGNGIVSVIPDLDDLHPILLFQAENPILHKYVVNDFLTFGEAAPGGN